MGKEYALNKKLVLAPVLKVWLCFGDKERGLPEVKICLTFVNSL